MFRIPHTIDPFVSEFFQLMCIFSIILLYFRQKLQKKIKIYMSNEERNRGKGLKNAPSTERSKKYIYMAGSTEEKRGKSLLENSLWATTN